MRTNAKAICPTSQTPDKIQIRYSVELKDRLFFVCTFHFLYSTLCIGAYRIFVLIAYCVVRACACDLFPRSTGKFLMPKPAFNRCLLYECPFFLQIFLSLFSLDDCHFPFQPLTFD
jgi:hypothetical protein